MTDSIRIVITKADQVTDDVSLEFATVADNPELPADALDLFIASSVWHLLRSSSAFTQNQDGTIRWTFGPGENDYADLSPARCVSVALRQFGEKMVAGRTQDVILASANQQAVAAAALVASSVTVVEG